MVKVERGGIYVKRLGNCHIEAVCGSPQCVVVAAWVGQNSNVANAYHTKSLADKV